MAEVSAVGAQAPPEAERLVLALLPVVVDLARLLLPALPEVVVELAVEEVSAEALHR